MLLQNGGVAVLKTQNSIGGEVAASCARIARRTRSCAACWLKQFQEDALHAQRSVWVLFSTEAGSVPSTSSRFACLACSALGSWAQRWGLQPVVWKSRAWRLHLDPAMNPTRFPWRCSLDAWVRFVQQSIANSQCSTFQRNMRCVRTALGLGILNPKIFRRM